MPSPESSSSPLDSSGICFNTFLLKIGYQDASLLRIDGYGLSWGLWKVELSSSDEPAAHQVIVEEREDWNKFPTHFCILLGVHHGADLHVVSILDQPRAPLAGYV